MARPEWLQGSSLLPLVQGETTEIRDQIHAEVSFHATYEAQRAIRTGKWLYIRRFVESSGPVLANVDESPSRDVWLERGWEHHRPAPEHLYDNIFDPMQRRNLVGDPDLTPVKAEMQARLEQWMRETDDPLLKGDIPLPKGASMNKPDARSANDPLIST